MKNSPLVSVIIPVYNGENYLAESIESVLAQVYRPVEIIVVDDGSSDRSADVARGFWGTVNYYCQQNSGIGAARNTGVLNANGSFLAFLDADDLWVKEKLSIQVPVLETNVGTHMVFGQVSHFYSPDLEQRQKERFLCPKTKMPGYHAGTMLIRTGAFHRVGLFNAGYQAGEFIDWYFRARERGLKELLLSDVLMRRRIHSSNMGIVKSNTRTDNSHADYIRVLKASLDRRRNKDNKCLVPEAGNEAG
jgi:glycosyltransferase involved in cell wall biosynthesis